MSKNCKNFSKSKKYENFSMSIFPHYKLLTIIVVVGAFPDNVSIIVYNIIDYRRRGRRLDRSIEAYNLFGKTPANNSRVPSYILPTIVFETFLGESVFHFRAQLRVNLDPRFIYQTPRSSSHSPTMRDRYL